jgi:hypothetical protein
VVNPNGGQIPPISIEGDKAEWKKPQKTEKKAKASETIKRSTPIEIPLLTLLVWSPKKVLSVTISLNQKPIPSIVIVKPRVITLLPWLNPCIHKTAPIAKFSKEKLTKIGQGDFVTK